MAKIPINLLHSSVYLSETSESYSGLFPIFPIPFTIMTIMFSVPMSGGGAGLGGTLHIKVQCTMGNGHMGSPPGRQTDRHD